MSKKAVLLANLGSPAQANTAEVRRYLNQFLMDPYVIQLPWALRRLIVSLFVLPSRPKQSAQAYQSVWTEQGSPLVVLSEQLRSALQEHVDIPVAMAMRYGQPSIESELLKLAQDNALTEVLYIPLYPHFADSTITTSIEEAKRVIAKHKLGFKLNVIAPFYQQHDYISALVESAKPYLTQPFDHLIFSYHGLPESHITKLDDSGEHCLKKENCCDIAHACHATCYKHQVTRTTQEFVKQTKLDERQYSIAFQSRLGRAKWLEPTTEDTAKQLAQQGAKNILVICPAFVTDCLETLEEIAIQLQESFEQAGGETVTLIPCMNTHPKWVETLSKWCNN
jgi:ferrochelatase